MKVSIIIKTKMELYHKLTMEKLVIDNSIERCYDEQNADYQQLCKEYSEESGMDREDNPNEFDKAIFGILAERAAERERETIGAINDVVRSCFSSDNVLGCVSFGGYIINPKDFCAVSIKDFSIRVNTEKE